MSKQDTAVQVDLRELRERAAPKGLSAAGTQTPPATPPLVPREIQRSVAYTNPETGLQETFLVTSRILTGEERDGVARLKGTLAGGVAWESLPLGDQVRFVAKATIAFQLRSLPKGLADWYDSDDTLCFALYGICEEHDRCFFRGDVGAGAKDKEQPRVVVGPQVPRAAGN